MRTRQSQQVSKTDGRVAPMDVFYVVHTTAGVSGERHHRVRSLLFETRRQARTELKRLREADGANGTYGIWKGTTYVEPAEWSYDVVMADGTVVPARRVPAAAQAADTPASL